MMFWKYKTHSQNFSPFSKNRPKVFADGLHGGRHGMHGGRMTSPDSAGLVYRIAETLAAAESVDIADLPPIGTVVDIEALEAFLDSCDGEAWATFTYYDWQIKVTAEGRITLSESPEDTGDYLSRCATCGEERQGMDLGTAQEFFASHAARNHNVQVARRGGQLDDTLESGSLESDELTETD